mmetsp:Transcript_8064/g.8926  ORF Transcript_8064/g.8926 Transcript_8064/m.8926 type:complete len:138 (-) Transcript_8064:844-1257(-)
MSKGSYKLKVRCIKAKNLPAADFNGFSDPYCKMKVGYDYNWIGKIYKTRKLKKTLNPCWNETFLCSVKRPAKDRIVFMIYDYDIIGKNDFLCEGKYELEKLPKDREVVVWLPLYKGRSPKGKIQVGLTAIGFGTKRM